MENCLKVNIYRHETFEVSMMMIQVMVFWVVTSCSDVVGCQRFGELYCAHHQGHHNITNGVTTHKTTTRVTNMAAVRNIEVMYDKFNLDRTCT